MPEQIDDNYDFSPYPWSQLFNGRTWRCQPGSDFMVKPETFRTSARAAARERGTAIDIKIEEDGCVVLRARGKPTMQVV